MLLIFVCFSFKPLALLLLRVFLSIFRTNCRGAVSSFTMVSPQWLLFEYLFNLCLYFCFFFINSHYCNSVFFYRSLQRIVERQWPLNLANHTMRELNSHVYWSHHNGTLLNFYLIYAFKICYYALMFASL